MSLKNLILSLLLLVPFSLSKMPLIPGSSSSLLSYANPLQALARQMEEAVEPALPAVDPLPAAGGLNPHPPLELGSLLPGAPLSPYLYGPPRELSQGAVSPLDIAYLYATLDSSAMKRLNPAMSDKMDAGLPRLGARDLSSPLASRRPIPEPAPLPAPVLDASVEIVVGPVGAPSQGTIVYIPGEGYALVTHDHYSRPALHSQDTLYFKEHGESCFTGSVDIRSNIPDSSRFQEVNIIPLGKDYEPKANGAVRMASPEQVGEIQVGDRVVVVYNDATRPGEFILRYATLRVTDVTAHAIQVADPGRLINKGDSGGAVYFNGLLVGVLWSIGEYESGPAVNISLLTPAA